MNVSRSSTKVFLAQVATTGIGFVGIAYFARRLGSAELGVFFLFQALVSVLVVGADFGIGTAVEQRMSGEGRRGETLSSALALYLGTFGLVVVGILAFADRVDAYVGAEVAGALVAVVVLMQLKRLFTAALKGELRVGEIAPLQVVEKATWLATGTVLVSSGYSAYGPIYGVGAGAAVAGLWAFLKLDTDVERPTLDGVRSLVGFAKYNAIPSIGLRVHNWMDVLVLGYFAGQAAVGAYEVAWQLAGVTTLLAGAIGTAVLPQASALEAEADRERIGRLISAAITPSLILVIPAAFGTLVLAPDLLGVIFGAEYAVAWVALIVLVAGKVPEAIQIVVGRCLLGIDEPNLVARATVYTIVLNLVLNVVLILQYGLVGAAVATTASFTVGLLFRVKYLARFVDLRVPYAELAWCTLAGAIMGAILYGVVARIRIDSLPILFGVVGLGAATYFPIVLLSGQLRRRAIEYKQSLTPG